MRSDFKWREVYARFVNLAYRTDRLDHMQKEGKKLGISVERFEAIRTIDTGWNREPYKVMFNRTRGAIGCMLSQMEVMKEALDRNMDCMVTEDDLKICSDFPERMDYAERFLNTHSWDIFWCGATVSVNPPYWNIPNNRELPLDNPLRRDAECTDDPRILRTFGCFCTYCYVINRDSILKILNLLDSVMSESIGIDHSMIRLQPQLNTFCLVPGSVFQIDNPSDIGQGITNFTPFLKLNGTLENSAYVFQDKMTDFDPTIFNWAEARQTQLMLLNIHELFAKYKMNVTGVIEVGAHWGQEYDDYSLLGVERFVFIEPCRDAFRVLKDKFGGNPNVKLYNHACGDTCGRAVMFTGPTNQGMSNSLLRPKVHLIQHPDVLFPDTEMVDVERLDNLEFDRSKYNLLNMDAQGFEGRILMGAIDTLKTIDYIYTEVNREFMYENCALIEDIDQLLPDFERVETGWASERHGWGDSFYVRKTLL